MKPLHPALRPGVIAGMLLVAACSGPVETEKGVLNEDAASLMRVAATTRAAGDSAAAIPLYQRAAKLAPESAQPLVALGQTLNELGAYSEASTAWSRALTLSPRDFDALSGFGAALTGLNQPHLALVRFEQALEVRPDDPTIHNSIGVAHDMLGNAQAAQTSYRAGLIDSPGSINLTNNLGLSLALSGQYGESITLLESVMEMPGVTARHRQNLALAYGLAGETDKAARIGRLDLDEQRVMQNLSFYAIIRDMSNHAKRVAAIGSLENAVTTARKPGPGN